MSQRASGSSRLQFLASSTLAVKCPFTKSAQDNPHKIRALRHHERSPRVAFYGKSEADEVVVANVPWAFCVHSEFTRRSPASLFLGARAPFQGDMEIVLLTRDTSYWRAICRAIASLLNRSAAFCPSSLWTPSIFLGCSLDGGWPRY